MHRTTAFSAAILAFLSAATAQAATLDLVNATNDGTTLVAEGATITAGFDTTLSVGDFVDNAVCPLSFYGCNGVMTLTFDEDVKNVTFEYGYGGPGDKSLVTLFDSSGMLITFFELTGQDVSFADLSGYGTLRTLMFDNVASTDAGYAFGNISYDLAAQVPLPAALPLMGAALGGLALLRRRKG